MDHKKDRHRMLICTICLKVKRSNNLKMHMKVHARKDTLKLKSNSANMHLNIKKGDTSFGIKREQISSFEIENEQMSNESIENELIYDDKIYDEDDDEFVQYSPLIENDSFDVSEFEGQSQNSSAAPSRYACPICSKSFTRMSNLLKHEKKQHSDLIGKIITLILSRKKSYPPILPDRNFFPYLMSVYIVFVFHFS